MLRKTLLFSIFLSFAASLTAAAQEEFDQATKDPGIRRRCEMMQAKVRRMGHLIKEYEKLKNRTEKLKSNASYNRKTAREKLSKAKKITQKRIHHYQKRKREMSEKLVRRGCPKQDFSQIEEKEIRKLFDQANSEGVFVDDQVLTFPSDQLLREGF